MSAGSPWRLVLQPRHSSESSVDPIQSARRDEPPSGRRQAARGDLCLRPECGLSFRREVHRQRDGGHRDDPQVLKAESSSASTSCRSLAQLRSTRVKHKQKDGQDCVCYIEHGKD